jgi:hypothetical protein
MSFEYKLKNDIKKDQKIVKISYKLLIIFLLIVELYMVKFQYDKYQFNKTLFENGVITLAYDFMTKNYDSNPETWLTYYNKELNKEIRTVIKNRSIQWMKWKDESNKKEILYIKINDQFYVKIYDDVIKEYDIWYILKQLLLIPFIMFIFFLIKYYSSKD